MYVIIRYRKNNKTNTKGAVKMKAYQIKNLEAKIKSKKELSN
jgi:hypothetical protein